ncbi:MAG: YihY/virulence factor BrkB family protein [Acidobacteriaceae bacterium]|nr:YihY/virulence factor BrkB family protein [Acidobacteriaceae bacterium]
MEIRRFGTLLSKTYSQWTACNAPRLGAALAYYTLLSLAPLAILTVTICGLIFQKSAEQDVLQQTRAYAGPVFAATLKTVLDNAHHPGSGIVATCIALLTLLFGASGVFLELRGALNVVWDAPPIASAGIRGFLLQRLASFLMVLSLGALLLASLIVSAVLAIVEKFATAYLPVPAAVLGEVANLVISGLSLALLFGLVFKYVPQVRVDWREVPAGAALTALLFLIGKTLLALYLTTTGVGSAYGAAGSVVALVVWVYYSAQIFLFGAMFTRVLSDDVAGRRPISESQIPLKSRSQGA